MMQNICPCCVPPVALGLLVTGAAVVSGLRAGFPAKGRASRCLGVVAWLIAALLAALALALTVLANHAGWRGAAFAGLCARMTQSGDMDGHRCETLGLSELSGDVIEFGPGPGTNFRCWSAAGVASWTGVEPNAHFAASQAAEAAARNLTFPRRAVWLKGEQVDVPPASFDAAVLTHVLCSVDSPAAVLASASRALRPGGKIFVLEHVIAPAERPLLGLVQRAVAPLLYIVGNGCQFRRTQDDLARAAEAGQYAPFSIEEFEAPVPLVFLKPHIMARSTKPSDA